MLEEVDILSKIVYYVVSSTYIIKEIEKIVSCVYGVITHTGNVGRIFENRVKHSATRRVLHASLVISQFLIRAHYHTIIHEHTRPISISLINLISRLVCLQYYCTKYVHYITKPACVPVEIYIQSMCVQR